MQLKQKAVDVVRRLRWRNDFREWKVDNPSKPFSAFYVDQVGRQIDEENRHKTLSVEFSEPDVANAGAEFVAQTLLDLGLRRSDTCVEFGCGALRIGGTVMPHIEVGNYFGLDVTDKFWKNGIERLGDEFIKRHRPRLELIDDNRDYEQLVDDPAFVISIAVLIHVPPLELEAFFSQLTGLMGQSTQLVLDARLADRTRQIHARSWSHSLTTIGEVVASHGLEFVISEPLVIEDAPEELLVLRKA